MIKPQEQEGSSPWSRCSADQCPLQASIQSGGVYLCTFHSASEGHAYAEISMAINQNLAEITSYNQMLRWSPSAWTSNFGNITTPNLYLQDKLSALKQKIKEDAAKSTMGPEYGRYQSTYTDDNGVEKTEPDDGGIYGYRR